MRIKIPIFVEIDGRLGPKDVEVLRERLNTMFTDCLLEKGLFKNIPLGGVIESITIEKKPSRVEKLIKQLEGLLPHLITPPNIEILNKEEFLNRIR